MALGVHARVLIVARDDALAGPLEEAPAAGALELGQLEAERGLSQLEALPGGRDRAGLSDDPEIIKMVVVEGYHWDLECV